MSGYAGRPDLFRTHNSADVRPVVPARHLGGGVQDSIDERNGAIGNQMGMRSRDRSCGWNQWPVRTMMKITNDDNER